MDQVGTVVWVFSLRQLETFSKIWATQSSEMQRAIQDTVSGSPLLKTLAEGQFSCCGYWNGTTAGLFGVAEGFCADETFAAGAKGCQTSSKRPSIQRDPGLNDYNGYGLMEQSRVQNRQVAISPWKTSLARYMALRRSSSCSSSLPFASLKR